MLSGDSGVVLVHLHFDACFYFWCSVAVVVDRTSHSIFRSSSLSFVGVCTGPAAVVELHI